MLNFSAKYFSAQYRTRLIITRVAAICCLLTLVLHGACKFPTEDPGALNSVQNYSTLQVRFVNLAADKSPRSFTAEYFAAGPQSLPMVGYGEILPAGTPRFDSARVLVPVVASDTNSRDTTVVRFTGRNLVYTLIALPQLRPESAQVEVVNGTSQIKKVKVPVLDKGLRQVDTVLALSASQDVIPAGFVRLRAVNCVYDSRHRFDLTVGCPSGEVIASGLPYRQASSYITTTAPAGADSLTVSLITKPTTATVASAAPATIVIGSFKIPAKSAQSYSILIYRNGDGDVDLLLVHDLRSEKSAAVAGSAPEARLRVVNVSGEIPLNFFYRVNGRDTVISLRPSKDSASAFANLTACQSVGRDTIVTTIVKNMVTSRVNAIGALNAGSAYTLLVGKNSRSEVMTLLAPVLTGAVTVGKARLRFVNFTPQPLFVMRGTTTGASNDALFSSLPTGVLTDTVLVNAGNLPLLLFNTTQPTQLLQTGIDRVTGGKSYIVIFTAGTNAGDPPRISLVEDSRDVQGAANIPVMPQGAFVQFMNARADNQLVTLNFGTSPDYISDVPLFYGTPQMTVLNKGEYQTSDFPLRDTLKTDANLNQKWVVFFIGAQGNGLRSFAQSGLRAGSASATATRFRYLNAALNFPGMYVNNETFGKEFSLNPLDKQDFGGVSRVFELNASEFSASRSFQLTFISTAQDTVKPAWITFSPTRAYSIIFSGRKTITTATTGTMQTTTTSNYNSIILQEY